MNQDRIDKIGVAALVNYFCMGGYINPHISFDDKIPIWDGTLDIHKSIDSLSAEDIDFVVDVQVKSSEVETFESEPTHALEVDKLKKYLSRGGTLLAKILIKGNDRKIFFAYLGKLEINKYLEDCKEDQEKKTIKFVEAPSDVKSLISNLRSIHLQGKYNLLSVDELSKRTDFTLQLTLGPMPKTIHPLLWMASHATDVLVNLPECKDPFYLEIGPSFFSTGRTVDEPVTVSDIIYFDSFRYSTHKYGIEFHVGNFLHYIPQGGGIANLNVKPNSTDLETYIKELQFVLALNKHKGFSLGSLHLNIEECVFDQHTIQLLSAELKFCNRLLKLFRVWKIDKPQICIKDLSEDTINIVDQFYQMYSNNTPIMADESQLPYRNFQIGKYNILFLVGSDAFDNRCLIDLSFCKTARFISKTEQIITLPVVLYLFSRNLFPDNLLYSNLSETLEQCKDTPNIYEIANQSALSLINAFDKSGLDRYITAAIEILNWCLAQENNELTKKIYRLNIIQCLKRKNQSISEADTQFLIDISIENPQLYFASNVLLKDKIRALAGWNRIPIEEQIELKTYPIYHLYENLINNNNG